MVALGTTRRTQAKRMEQAGWLLLAFSVLSVLAVGSLGTGCAVVGDDVAAAEQHTQEQLLAAVQWSLDDARWEHPELREALCGALHDNVDRALTSGAIAGPGVVQVAWHTSENVVAGFAHAAAARGSIGTDRYARVNALVNDARWALRGQRGPLCNALIHAEHDVVSVS